MAYTNLINDIKQAIYNNGEELITGKVLQDVLVEMVNNLGSGYTYKGVATLSTTPDTTTPNIFYLLGDIGTYTNIGSIQHQSGIGIAVWDGTNWSYQNVPMTTEMVTEKQEIANITSASDPLYRTLKGYIDPTTGAFVSYNGYSTTLPIHLSAGAIVKYRLNGNGIAYLCEANGADDMGAYTVILSGNLNRNTENQYIAPRDMWIVMCSASPNGTTDYINITEDKSLEGIIGRVDNLEREMEELSISDDTPTQDSNRFVRSGGVYDALVYDSELVNLTESSPYFVEANTNMYMPFTNFVSNEYTSGYKVYLFRIPANKTLVLKTETTATASTGTIFATIDSEADFVNGGTIHPLLAGNRTAQELRYTTTEETLLVFQSRAASGYYNYYGTLEEKIDETLVEKVTELDGRVSDLEQDSPKIDIITQIGEPVTAWQLANDLDFFTGYYSYKNIGQYTKIQENAVSFTQVRINQIVKSQSIAADTAKYRIYITNAGVGQTRECPVGVLGNPSKTYTLIKSGEFQLPAEISDVIIDLGNIYTCNKNEQVAIYMSSESGYVIGMKGTAGGSGNPEMTSNVALLCTGDDPFGASAWGKGTVSANNTGYMNVALTLLYKTPFATTDELSQAITQAIDEQIAPAVASELASNLDLIIPETIYAVVGTELNLWNDTLAKCASRGLQTPTEYSVSWYQSSIGMVTNRGFRFTPQDTHAGNAYNVTCRVYDVIGNLAVTKTIAIKVLAKNALASAKRIVFFGDSTGANTAIQMYNDFHNTDKFSGTAPSMIGTNHTGSVNYEAVGGYRWLDYSTQGRAAFRCVISSNAPAIPLGASYTNNGFTWRVVEVNITGGAGNILITKDSLNYTDTPQASGVLTPVDASLDPITYTSYTNAPANPLWDSNANALSITHYKSVLGLSSSDKIDAVSFFLGLNGSSTNAELTQQIKDLYNAFIADNSSCKFIIGLITDSNTENGYGINYGASIPSRNNEDRIERFNKLYLSLLEDETMPNLRICPSANEVDRYYGYQFTTRQISQRYTETESVHSNAVHPATSGYGQFGDAFFATFIGVLTE